MKRILLTGGTGYLAKHIALRLLRAGFVVRATVRDSARQAEIEQAVGDVLSGGNLEAAECDLTRPEGWRDAMQGCDALVHTASPFPPIQPRDENALMGPAVAGTEMVLSEAANAGISRVVLTSSIAAIIYSGEQRAGGERWTDPGYPGLTPYAKSKTLAERAAWWVAEDNGLALTTINPGFIIGPPLGARIGTSLLAIQRLLKGSDPVLPKFGFPTVDVRDVAEIHVRALTSSETIGERLIASDRFLWYSDMARLLRGAYPLLAIRTRTAPDALVRLLAMFDPSARSILPDLSRKPQLDASRAEHLLGRPFRDVRATLIETANTLLERRLISA